MRWGRDEAVQPSSAWDRRIMLESLIWERYGCPVDLARDRPAEEFEAHAAIVQGRNEKEYKEQKKAEREADRNTPAS